MNSWKSRPRSSWWNVGAQDRARVPGMYDREHLLYESSSGRPPFSPTASKPKWGVCLQAMLGGRMSPRFSPLSSLRPPEGFFLLVGQLFAERVRKVMGRCLLCVRLRVPLPRGHISTRLSKNYWDFDVWEKRRGLFFWRRSVEYDWACYLALLGEGVAWYRKGVRAMRRAGKRLNHVLTRNWTTVRRCELLSSVLYQEEMPRSILSISEFKNTSDVGKTQAPPNCVTVAHATSNHATFRVCVQECQHISGFQTTGPQKTFFIWMRNQGLNSLIKSTSKFLTLSVSETKSFSNPKCSQKLPLTNPETFMHLRQHARTEPTTDEDQIRLSGLQGQSLLLVCLLAWPFRFEIWKNLGKSQKKRKIT